MEAWLYGPGRLERLSEPAETVFPSNSDACANTRRKKLLLCERLEAKAASWQLPEATSRMGTCCCIRLSIKREGSRQLKLV